jgi:two-component system phosphoglycerate transport system response regulator PgtA
MKQILIVEDDADLVETYTDLLEMHQYSVLSTPKSIDAIGLIMRRKPSVVLLDLNLAGYSGTVVINMVRGYKPLKDTKIIVITGHPEMLNRYDASRVDLVLNKPISNEKLLETIKQFTTAE